MLVSMISYWAATGHPHYPPMEAGQSIAYISDVGAFTLKPWFIAGSTVTVVFLDIGFVAERWLRHTGRLAKNTSNAQKILSSFALLFAILGAAGIILLSIFDTYHHQRLHDGFLLLFLGGYIISAIFLCAEYQRLGIHYRNHRVLAMSFWIKLAFIIIELILAIIFVGATFSHHKNVGAVVEWIIAFIYTFWVLSFVIDLLPSVRTKHHIPQGYKDGMMMEQGMNATFSQQSTRHGSYEQNLTSDSAGPNRPRDKYVIDGQRSQGGRLSRIFSNLR